MPIYTDVFGGANIYPSEISYSSVSLTADIALSWPEETSASNNLATRIIDVSASVANFVITLPDAMMTGTGQTILFNNVGSSSFIVKSASGVQIISVAIGTAWQVYLTNNTTSGGVWIALQYGAAISSANASALAGTGIIAVGTLLSQSMPVVELINDYVAGLADRAKTYIWKASGSGSIYMPDPTTVGNNWFIVVRNSGGGQLVVDPSSSNIIDGGITKSYQPGDSSIIVSDGTDYYTIGYGQPTEFAFDYTVVNVAGTGNYTLTGSELNRIVYKFTGVLTGARNVVVPDTVQQYWVDNGTTGSYDLTVKSTTGTGVIVPQGGRLILYCDGADVLKADTAGIATPISIANGGTGATNAGTALLNLGGTSVGTALFTAVDQAAAWASLGDIPYLSGGVF